MNFPSNEYRKKSLTTENCSHLNYYVRGSGEPILFLHGFPTSGLLWDETARIMSKKFTCIYPDLPGWGESAPFIGNDAKATKLLEASIPVIEALETALGKPFKFIVSTDAGAVIAAFYAAVRPQNVERLVLMSAPLFPDFRIPMPMRVLRTPYIGSAASLVIKPLMFKSLGLENRLLHRYTEAHRRSFSFQFKGISGSVKLARLVRWGTPKDVMTPLSELLPEYSSQDSCRAL